MSQAGIAIISSSGGEGFSQVVERIFTSSGTYTPTSGMKYCIVECVGGGGSSSGCLATSAIQVSVSGGAGGGQYCRKIFSSADIGASQSVVVGAGGVGGSPGNPGTSGGLSIFGAFMAAVGGPAATVNYGPDTSAVVSGGVGGGTAGGSGGDFGTSGAPGGDSFGFYTGTGFFGYVGISGVGGSSFLGGGAPSVGAPLQRNGGSYGGGARGLFLPPGSADTFGGNGYGGIVIITEFI